MRISLEVKILRELWKLSKPGTASELAQATGEQSERIATTLRIWPV